MKKPSLAELERARLLLNEHAPNLYGQLPRIIFCYHPDATEAWLNDETLELPKTERTWNQEHGAAIARRRAANTPWR